MIYRQSTHTRTREHLSLPRFVVFFPFACPVIIPFGMTCCTPPSASGVTVVKDVGTKPAYKLNREIIGPNQVRVCTCLCSLMEIFHAFVNIRRVNNVLACLHAQCVHNMPPGAVIG